MKKYYFLMFIFLSLGLGAIEVVENDEATIKLIFLKPFKQWKYEEVGGRLINDLNNLYHLCGPCGQELEQSYQTKKKESILNFAFEINEMKMLVINDWKLAFWEALFEHNIDISTPLKNKKTLKQMAVKTLKIVAREGNWYSDSFENCVKLLKLIKNYEKQRGK